MKRIGDFMTPQPWTLQLDDSLAVARRMLAERDIRHLPVLDGGIVVGMVTERELASSADRLGTAADVLVPADRIGVDTLLDEALDLMTSKHRDAVIVTDRDRVVGIFTASDAMRVLADLLRQRAA